MKINDMMEKVLQVSTFKDEINVEHWKDKRNYFNVEQIYVC